MAIYFTNTVRVKAGHMLDYLASAPKGVAVYEKYGVKFLGVFQASPGEANVVVWLVSMRDWAAYGEALQKMPEDADFQALNRETGNYIDGSVIQGLVPLPGSSMQ